MNGYSNGYVKCNNRISLFVKWYNLLISNKFIYRALPHDKISDIGKNETQMNENKIRRLLEWHIQNFNMSYSTA